MLRRVVVVLALVSGAVGVGVLAPAALAEGVCANEALRVELHSGGLPECRAYERVSPGFKDSSGVFVIGVSSHGSRVIGESNGAFAGTGSDSIGAFYEFSRAASGWEASAISPLASLFPANLFLAAGADLGRTLWALRGPSQPLNVEDIYVREADGRFVRVGPMVPPSAAKGPPSGGFQLFLGRYSFAGASSDLSHVLFWIQNGGYGSQVWPGDTTSTTQIAEGFSLYEYVGTGNEQPAPVGVNGEGRVISDCATYLGDERKRDTYNAVSTDGETVFFTAQGHSNPECASSGVSAPEVSEVYARLGHIETVPVSEPSSAQCGYCNTSVKAAAEFQGASRDGSKVFFLTEQELFSGDTSMNLYEYDFDNKSGNKVVRVSVGSAAPEVQGVARVSQDGSHVYFVAKGVLTEGANAEGREPVSAGENLYVFERDAAYPEGRIAFVATLSEGDSADWATVDSRPVQATPDGRFLVFGSAADLTPGDSSSEPQVFEYDAVREELVRVSVGQAGFAAGMANANANGSSIAPQGFSEVFKPSEAGSRLAVSADGSDVVFEDFGALTADADPVVAAAGGSVYEYRSSGSLSNGDVYLVAPSHRGALGLDASGEDVFFSTLAPLLSQDGDSQLDVYDARVGGGFAAPVVGVGCEGEACQGASAVQPSFGGAGSVSATGGGNLPPPPPASVAGARSKPPAAGAGRLARALKVCRAVRVKRRRAVCEARARRRYAGKSSVNVKGRG